MKTLLLFTLLTASASLGFSQRLLTEDFNYTPGQLTSASSGANVSGGNWTSHSGTAQYIQVVPGNLTYPNYSTGASATNNNKVAINAITTSAEDANRFFAPPATPPNSGTVYMSFLINVRDLTGLADNTLPGDYFTGFLNTASTSTLNTIRIYAKKGVAANTFMLGISVTTPASTVAAAPVYSAGEYAVGTTHLVTAAYQFVPG